MCKRSTVGKQNFDISLKQATTFTNHIGDRKNLMKRFCMLVRDRIFLFYNSYVDKEMVEIYFP